MNVIEIPKQRYECLNCGSIIEINRGLNQDKINCTCGNKKLVLLSSEYTEEELANFKEDLILVYMNIVKQYEKYFDWDIDEIKIQSIWDIGTYCYKMFDSFPYRYITAMKGSGKTKLLELSEILCYNGKLAAGMSDSALFRLAEDHTLFIDEAEQIGRKEKQVQREILNSGYKKSGKIIKVKEKQTKEGKTFVTEEFNVYSPKMLANIFGMEDVLGDRCISSILERSNNPAKTKLITDFSSNPEILAIKTRLNELQCSLCSVVSVLKWSDIWNNYILDKYTTTYITITTLTTLDIHKEELFNKIDNTGIDGRQLELYFPLIIIADSMGEEILDEILEIIIKKNRVKKENDYIENYDISLLDFVSKLDIFTKFYSVNELTYGFREYVGMSGEETSWVNRYWLGRALNRLKIVFARRRVSQGIEVRLDIMKAKEKLKIFKVEDEPK